MNWTNYAYTYFCTNLSNNRAVDTVIITSWRRMKKKKGIEINISSSLASLADLNRQKSAEKNLRLKSLNGGRPMSIPVPHLGFRFKLNFESTHPPELRTFPTV